MENQDTQTGGGRKLPKPNNAFNVPVASAAAFFRAWCVFLRPFVVLTEKELDVAACFLKHRWILSKSISDPAVLDTMVMNEQTKKKVRTECGISLQHFYVIMSTLRKKGVIKGNIINPRLIPNKRDTDNGVFQLLIMFKEENQ